MAKRLPMHTVPCRGCRLCCQGDAVRLEDEDLGRGYETEPHPYIPGALMLAHRPNGDCVYLGVDGCTIHGRAPALCRAADCRSIALRYDLRSAQALHGLGRLNFAVWDKGNDLLAELRAEVKEGMRARLERETAQTAGHTGPRRRR
jgi:hypothetical protein